MHELSIALSLVELACEEAERLQARRVEALHVRVGPFSGVVKEALLFSFDIAAAGTSIDGARLKVEDTAGRELELFALEIAE
jgi:hydrogenase nickel incorporation protein HypA/HybF